MSAQTKQDRLCKDTWTVGVHGTTGQDTDEGWLPAGTLVRDVRESRDGDGWDVTHFKASTDGGATWYEQRTYGRIEIHR